MVFEALRAVLARNDGMQLGAEKLLDAHCANGSQSLRKWFARAAVTVHADAEHFNDGFLARRTSAGKYYLIQHSVLEVAGKLVDPDEAVRYVAFITDPEATQLPPALTLQALYGLTKAEARVALQLASGRSLKEVANDLRVSLPTVKTQSQNIYQNSASTGTPSWCAQFWRWDRCVPKRRAPWSAKWAIHP